jgi:hypothetical protein
MTNDTRADFEACYLARYPHMDFSRNMPDGSYNSPALYGAWPVWEAAYLASRRAALEDGQRLREAAQEVIDRWDTPLWKNAEATAVFINRLRRALADEGVKP